MQVATRLVVSSPSVLTLSATTLGGKLHALRAASALQPHWARQLAESSPQALGLLLCFSAQRWGGRAGWGGGRSGHSPDSLHLHACMHACMY